MVICVEQNKQFALTKIGPRAISPQWELVYNYFSLIMHAHKHYQIHYACVYICIWKDVCMYVQSRSDTRYDWKMSGRLG